MYLGPERSGERGLLSADLELDPSITHKMPASPLSPCPGVSIPTDILDRPREERIQLAIAAIHKSGTKPDGDPIFSTHQAEKHFDIPRSTLGRRLLGA
jgi:helix-turn-helix, Psq domain